MTHNEMLASVRFTAWALEAGVAVFAAHYVYNAIRTGYRLSDRDRVRVGIGLSIKAAGWALHQFYWWLWEMSIVRHMPGVQESLERTSLLTVLAYIMIFGGEALIISPWLVAVFGRWWPATASLGIIALFGVGVGFVFA